mgnify:CR=1 FL=1
MARPAPEPVDAIKERRDGVLRRLIEAVPYIGFLGIDFDRPKDAVDRIIAEPDVLERISAQGRAFALKHYSPVPVAERFLTLIGREVPQSDTVRAMAG